MVSTEIKAAHILLEKGSGLQIPAPFFYRLIGKKTLDFAICMPTASVCLEIIRMRLSMGVTDEEFEAMNIEKAMRFMLEHGETVARIVAHTILRSGKVYGMNEASLARRLLKYCPFSTLLEVMQIITIESGIQDFTIIIGLLKTMRITKPNDPSQRDQRS